MKVAVALAPLVAPPAVAVTLILAAVFLQGAFSAAVGSAWNPWMRDVVPEDRLGAFFSRRQQLGVAVSIPLSLGAGWFVTWWAGRFPARELLGYSLLFLAGVAVGLLSLYFVWNTPEPRMPAVAEPPRLRELVSEPLRDDNFRRLLAFLGSWNFAIALATPFFTVYVLQRLGYGMDVVVALAVLSQLSNVVFVRVWGRLADRFSNKAVLGVSGPLVLASVFLWLFTAMPDPYRLTFGLLVAIHGLLGASMAGVTLATGNIGLKLAPRGHATAYLAVNGLVGSLAAAVGPLAGGALAGVVGPYSLALRLDLRGPTDVLSVNTLVVEGLDFVFLAAVVAGLYAMHRLALVVEAGRIERSTVVRSLLVEVTRPLGSFTSVGVAELFDVPLDALGRTRRAVRNVRTQSRRNRRE